MWQKKINQHLSTLHHGPAGLHKKRRWHPSYHHVTHLLPRQCTYEIIRVVRHVTSIMLIILLQRFRNVV